MDDLKTVFGRQLKQARERCGYTQEVLGEQIGLDRNSVARIERGEQGVRWNAMEKIVQILGEPPSFYFSDNAPKSSETKSPTLDSLLDLIKAQETRINQLQAQLADEGRAMPSLAPMELELLAAFAALKDDQTRAKALFFIRGIAHGNSGLPKLLADLKKNKA